MSSVTIKTESRLAFEAMREQRPRQAFNRAMVGRQYGKEETAEAWGWFLAGYQALELEYSNVQYDRDQLTRELQAAAQLRSALKEFLE